MNFLRNHYEKVIFAMVAVALLVSAGLAYRWAEAELARVNAITPAPPKGAAIESAKTTAAKHVEEIIKKLDDQKTWTTKPQIFQPTFTAREKKVGSAKSLVIEDIGFIDRGIGIGTGEVVKHDKIETAMRVAGIQVVPFNLMFKGSFGVGANAKYQIGFLNKRKTPIVAIGETVEGFTIKAYREKKDPNGKDISQLDIQRGNEPVVTLIYLQVQAIGTENVVTISDLVTNKDTAVKLGDVFTNELDVKDPKTGKNVKVELKVVDIKPPDVIVETTAAPKTKYKFSKGAVVGVKVP